jgi:lysozyme family protein
MMHLKHSLLTFALAFSLSACGTDDVRNTLEGSSLGGKADQKTDDTPILNERSAKAFDSDADFQDFENAEMNVYGTSEESRYFSYKAEYDRLWQSLAVRPDKSGTVDWYLSTIVKNKDRYMKIQEATGVPWYWVGITHGLEAGFNFGAHLHNGDPLTARTKLVPAGRPLTGTAPFSWEVSAIDAITQKGYQTWTDWHLPSMLAYAWERYNGFGYRSKGIASPYLWSMSYHYTRGKYTYDGYYDPSAVSAQAGTMALLKRGVERGFFTLSEVEVPEVVKADDVPTLKRSLTLGVPAGRDVLLLKMRLKSYGHFSGLLNGQFDDATVSAVKSAQKAHALTADGVVGPLTWNKLWPKMSDAGWMKAWKKGDRVDLRAMQGDRCLFKIVAKEVPALTPFLDAGTLAKTISFGGEAEKAVMPGECPEIRETYDIAKAVITAPPANTPAAGGTPTGVTWHKLYRGDGGEWNVNSFNGGSIVTSLKTRSKDDLVKYLKFHAGAHSIATATNDEVPFR